MIEFQRGQQSVCRPPGGEGPDLELRAKALSSVLVGTSGSGKSDDAEDDQPSAGAGPGCTIRFCRRGHSPAAGPDPAAADGLCHPVHRPSSHWTVAQNIATVPQLQKMAAGSDRRPDRRADGAAGAGGDAARPLTRISSPAASSSGWGGAGAGGRSGGAVDG